MKTIVMTLMALFMASSMVAQQRIKEKDVLGTWKFKLDLKEAIDEESEDMGFFEGMIAKAVSGMAQDIVNEMDITFNFKRDHVVLLTINNIEEDKEEIEELTWQINDRGYVVIDDIDNDNVQVNNDGYWIVQGDKLIAYDDDGSEETKVWMERAR
ncbi:hypothetical protein [Robertkochia sediminum]|uniref:hypothetical protein n=1 Tax=Robertkochia sediminum TaxID=2785326 RepID=UPI00193117BD|nr:hypothetical protein [Robertkochia sediminum]MBL7471442.1 hypothetical protein [Robertkochia sediminum]